MDVCMSIESSCNADDDEARLRRVWWWVHRVAICCCCCSVASSPTVSNDASVLRQSTPAIVTERCLEWSLFRADRPKARATRSSARGRQIWETAKFLKRIDIRLYAFFRFLNLYMYYSIRFQTWPQHAKTWYLFSGMLKAQMLEAEAETKILALRPRLRP